MVEIGRIETENYNNPVISVNILDIEGQTVEKAQEEVASELVKLIQGGEFNRLDNGTLFAVVSGGDIQKQEQFLRGVSRYLKIKGISTKIWSNSKSFLGFKEASKFDIFRYF